MTRRTSHTVLLLALLLPVTLPVKAVGQTFTVQTMLDEQEKWPEWVRQKTTLSIDGRYEGRVANQFRLDKLSILLTPTRTAAIPAAIQAEQRMTVSGVLRKSGTRYFMDVSRIAVGSTDSNKLAARIEKLGADSPEQWYPLADEYAAIADFYKDEFLQKQVAQLRIDAFTVQRKQFKGDTARLLKLADFGAGLGIAPSLLAAIRFEGIVALTKTESVDRVRIYQVIESTLNGWDQQQTFADTKAEQRFLTDPVAEYERADDVLRAKLHRRFYRTVKLPEIMAQLKRDGSNGQEVAQVLAEILPEETTQVELLRKAYVDYRLSRVPVLTRRQLEELDRLLKKSKRGDESKPAIERWLQAQEERLNNDQLDGILATAEEFLFAFERWRNPKHRDVAVDLLKRGWLMARNAAPKEATAISQRLEQFGWTRLRGQWMTIEQITDLPRDDVELAMREGRVVVGMTARQVVGTLGQPNRTIRVISARQIQEIWVYGEAGSSAITVHVQRGRREKPDAAVVTLVSKIL